MPGAGGGAPCAGGDRSLPARDAGSQPRERASSSGDGFADMSLSCACSCAARAESKSSRASCAKPRTFSSTAVAAADGRYDRLSM